MTGLLALITFVAALFGGPADAKSMQNEAKTLHASAQNYEVRRSTPPPPTTTVRSEDHGTPSTDTGGWADEEQARWEREEGAVGICEHQSTALGCAPAVEAEGRWIDGVLVQPFEEGI